MENFLYADEYASDHKLRAFHFNTSASDVSDTISQLTTDQIKAIGSDEFISINPTYSSALTIEFELGKLYCGDETDNILSPEEYSKINRWLNRKEPHKFKIVHPGYENIYFMGRFNITPIKINEDIYGIKCTFISNYPYGFVDEVVQDYTAKSIESTDEYKYNFTIYNHSDEIGDMLPIFAFDIKESGDLKLINSLDNEICVIKNCVAGEHIVIDSKHRIITSNQILHKIYNDFNYNYPKLINTYVNRVNVFKSTLDLDITVTYSPIRKVGF